MSERAARDPSWLAELAALAIRWADTEDHRWGKRGESPFADALVWSSAWAATRFSRLSDAAPSPQLVDELPTHCRAAEATSLGPASAPTIPERIGVSEPEPATLARAASTLLGHGGSELVIGPDAARMWSHFEPVLGPRLAARGVSVRLGDDADTAVSALAHHGAACATVSLDGDVDVSTHGVVGFGGAPIDVVIAPYLHDARDLKRLGDHLVSELAAPAPGVTGVRLLVAESWLQRGALRVWVEGRLSELRRNREALDGRALELRWSDAREGAPGRHAITERALDAKNTAALFDAARACAEEAHTSPLVASAYVAPFLLETDAAAKSFERWRSAHPARVVVLNQRASHAFALGRHAWSDGEHVLPALGASSEDGKRPPRAGTARRTHVDAPFLSPLEGRRMLLARLRFERSPTSLAALRLRVFDGLARF